MGDNYCVNCGDRVVLVHYAMGSKWVHQEEGASFQDGVHEYCHTTKAEPEPLVGGDDG